jgi:2-methylcitrate dehydratase PrpD
MGVFGATAAAGMLIGLTAKQMLNAFGIAYSHAAGNRQCILDGALTKRMQVRNLVRDSTLLQDTSRPLDGNEQAASGARNRPA